MFFFVFLLPAYCSGECCFLPSQLWNVFNSKNTLQCLKILFSQLAACTVEQVHCRLPEKAKENVANQRKRNFYKIRRHEIRHREWQLPRASLSFNAALVVALSLFSSDILTWTADSSYSVQWHIKWVDVEENAYYVNKLGQNVGLETWAWRQIVTSQTAHIKYKWPPYATEWNPPMKIFCVRHWAPQIGVHRRLERVPDSKMQQHA